MFGSIGPWELVLILLIALIVVGPSKLPDVAKSIGKGMNEFKKATSGVRKEFEDAIKEPPPKPVYKNDVPNPLDQLAVHSESTNEVELIEKVDAVPEKVE